MLWMQSKYSSMSQLSLLKMVSSFSWIPSPLEIFHNITKIICKIFFSDEYHGKYQFLIKYNSLNTLNKPITILRLENCRFYLYFLNFICIKPSSQCTFKVAFNAFIIHYLSCRSIHIAGKFLNSQTCSGYHLQFVSDVCPFSMSGLLYSCRDVSWLISAAS